MTDKPETRITKTLAAMATGRPLHKIQQMCERQKSVTCSVLAQMVEEAQDINTDYALTFKYGHEASRAADKARIAELERLHEVSCRATLLGFEPGLIEKIDAALAQQGKEGWE